MKNLLCFFALLLLAAVRSNGASPAAVPAAADSALLAAVAAADDERQAASEACDRTRLGAILSDELHYAHSNGKIDDKASYIEALGSKQTIYENFDYQNRTFLPAGPGVVLM